MINHLRNSTHNAKIFSGAPGGIRTPSLLVRSQALYPIGLQALITVYSIASIHPFVKSKIWLPTGAEVVIDDYSAILQTTVPELILRRNNIIICREAESGE